MLGFVSKMLLLKLRNHVNVSSKLLLESKIPNLTKITPFLWLFESSMARISMITQLPLIFSGETSGSVDNILINHIFIIDGHASPELLFYLLEAEVELADGVYYRRVAS
jgi:hypothetical protein